MEYVVINDEKIEVNTAYRCCKLKRKTNTIIINQQYYLRKNDIVGFLCPNCKTINEQRFRFKMKFLKPTLCNSCNKSLNNPYKREDVKEKIKNIKLEKYGNPEFTNREKAKNTMIDKYGVEYPYQNEKLFNKMKQTNLKRYGAGVYNSSEVAKEKKRKEFYDELLYSDRLKNRVKPLFTVDEYDGGTLYKKYKWECLRCGKIFEYHIENGCIPVCPKCCPKKTMSKEENKFYEFIKKFKTEIIRNDRELIKPFELDFYVPNYNLAIEFNGIYWHSEKVISSKYYHQNKVKMCYDRGIRLLHIWEDDWLENKKEIKEKILHYINNIEEEIKPREPMLEERRGFKIWT